MRLTSLALIPLAALFGGVVVQACTAQPAAHESDGTGRVTLALQTTSVSGKTYRLRDASFTIIGPTTTTLSTPSPAVNDTEQFLRTALVSGNYSIRLQPGWRLWRIAPDGSEGIVTAEMTSPNPAEFQVTNGTETPVQFAFKVVDDGTISFGSGSGRVEIVVTEGDGGTSCVPVAGPDVPDDLFKDTNCDGIDGDASQAIFVATDGDDMSPGTAASPKRTIQGALTAATAAMKTQVYVSAGTYTAPVTLTNGISIFGGYARSLGWSRGAGNITVLENRTATTGGSHVITVRGTTITAPTTLDRLTIRAGDILAPTAPAGVSMYGLHCTQCTGLTLRNSIVVAGVGSDGTPGADGMPGAIGGPGIPGGDGQPDGTVPGPGGAGGTSSCMRTGGKGGDGALRNSSGQPGLVAVGGTPAGNGGFTGDPGGRGGDGQAGASGSAGANGAASAPGAIDSGLWVTAPAAAGIPGVPGNGGGGGGGGGSQNCTFCIGGTGNGAGGGGAGGCQGTQGLGGGSAGGSFGMVLVDSNGFRVVASTFQSNRGGTGGLGGRGGTGGFGGAGANGGQADPSQIGIGGRGGNGGRGGDGGHGGGGAGGSSIAIVLVRTMLDTTSSTTTPGAPGAGGSSAGNSGPSGVSVAVLNR
jgi:hypothetical protein